MASDFELNNVFRGDFIVAQTEVIFFKRKKKKKKQQTPRRCILLITHDTVALTDPKRDNKPVLMFPRNTITNFRYNTDDSQYKLEISVFIGSKTHELCIEFPTHDAQQQRDTFIQHFTADKSKPLNNNNNHTQSQAQTTTNTTNTPNNQIQKMEIDNHNHNSNNTIKQQATKSVDQIMKNNNSQPSSSSRRGTKRKHHTMNEETLRKRACKLASHKHLATLYKTLVGKNVLSASEFWDEYGGDIDIMQSSNGLIEGISNTVLQSTINNTTWSLFSEFKQDIDLNDNQPENEEESQENKHKLVINLTPERILKIFVNLPEVKLAYDKNVPFNLSEKEFWKAFLQSHYFKRGTTRNVTSGISDKETQIDKLLKKYNMELQCNNHNNHNNHMMEVSPSPSHNILNNENSFEKQLQSIQLAKNKEVDVEGALKKMREDIAIARAVKDGGDMKQFVDKIESGDINVNVNVKVANGHGKIGKIGVGKGNSDVDMDMKERNNDNYKRKLNILDASVDLSLTQDSFMELIEDPGVDENKNMRREDIQNWFSLVNKHGRMLLYQSVNQRKKNKDDKNKKNIDAIMTNVPKINYGRKYCMELNEYESKMNELNGIDRDDRDVRDWDEMEYIDRLNKETEFKDLKVESSKNFIELQIGDQSVYWGDNLLLLPPDLIHINQVAKQLNDYLYLVEQKKKKLAQLEVQNLIASKFVEKTIVSNTTNNLARNAANNNENLNANNAQNKKDVLMIYTQDRGEIKANKRILDQLSVFQKPMKELVRHYWDCFPANQEKINKSNIIVTQLKEYKLKLVQFQSTLDKKNSYDYKIQKVLLQELIDLADKVLEHQTTTRKTLQQKKMKRKQIMSSQHTKS